MRILRILNEDARKSYRDIAGELKVSASTVSSHIRRMESAGVISGYAPIIDQTKAGFDVLAVIGLRISHGKLLEVQRRIARDERVYEVYDVTGEWDSIIIVRFRSTRDLDSFVKKLGSMEHVERTYTQVVLNIVKEEKKVFL